MSNITLLFTIQLYGIKLKKQVLYWLVFDFCQLAIKPVRHNGSLITSCTIVQCFYACFVLYRECAQGCKCTWASICAFVCIDCCFYSLLYYRCIYYIGDIKALLHCTLYSTECEYNSFTKKVHSAPLSYVLNAKPHQTVH